MNNLEKFKAELAKDLSANMYSEEYILQRLENLCLIAISQGKIEGANLEIIGEHLTEPESIKPEDMVKGEWYVLDSVLYDGKWMNTFLFRLELLENSSIFTKKSFAIDDQLLEKQDFSSDELSELITIQEIASLRKATREEVTKYFPNEFMPPEIDAHGGNDKGFICPASN